MNASQAFYVYHQLPTNHKLSIYPAIPTDLLYHVYHHPTSDRPTNHPTNWLSDRLSIQPANYLTDWLSDRLPTGYPTDWVSDRLAIRPTDYPTDWLSD